MDRGWDPKVAEQSATSRLDFHASLTVEAVLLALSSAAVAGFLVYEGMWANTTWPGKHRGDVLLGIGTLIAVLLVFVLLRNVVGRSVKLTSQFFVLRRGATEERIPWDELVFKPGTTKRRFLRRCYVVTVKGVVIPIDSAFFRDFQTLTTLIEDRCTKSQSERRY